MRARTCATRALPRASADSADLGLTLPVRLKLIDETSFTHIGRLDFVDNAISRASGTIRARAVFANPDRTFAPGMFARVQMAAAAPADTLLVPEAAIGAEQARKFVMVVDADNVARPKYVTLGPVVDGLRVVAGIASRRQRHRQRADPRASGRQGRAASAEHAEHGGRARPDAGRTDMRLSHFFIDRPIFAAVLSIVIVIVGAIAVTRLPIAQYPEIAPPVVRVSGQYPGASADVVADTVVAPLEQGINGVEKLLYITSNATGDGRFQIDVTFDLGTNLDIAQVQVQNRVAIALPRRAGRRAQHRRHHGEELARPDDGRAPAIRPTGRATRCSSRTTPPPR